MGAAKFICSDCGKTLKGSAVCVTCENNKAAEREQNYRELLNNIRLIINASGLKFKKPGGKKPSFKKNRRRGK